MSFGKFSFTLMTKYWRIIYPSGHTVLDRSLAIQIGKNDKMIVPTFISCCRHFSFVQQHFRCIFKSFFPLKELERQLSHISPLKRFPKRHFSVKKAKAILQAFLKMGRTLRLFVYFHSFTWQIWNKFDFKL